MSGMSIDGDRKTKKLRSSEPDLKVVLGSGDDAVSIWYNAPTLASKSKFIDTMLAVPMREKEARTITFPDIAPDTWDKMIEFLESPVAARRMTARDALAVAIFYDKYEFTEGCQLCNQVIVEYFNSASEMEKDHSIDIDLVVESAVVAHGANLIDAQKQSLEYVLGKLDRYNVPYGRTMFTEGHLEKLLPFMADENAQRLGCREKGFYKPATDFPQKYVSLTSWRYDQTLLHQCISHLELSGTECIADGAFFPNGEDHNTTVSYAYVSEREVSWEGQTTTFVIEKGMRSNSDDDDDDKPCVWTIKACHPPTTENPIAADTTCWIAPCSWNMDFPPRTGWKSTNSLARGSPVIKYILNKEI